MADTTLSLSKSDHFRLQRRIQDMQLRFPQLVMQVVIHHFPAEHPFAMYVFWLFNAASFAGSQARGKDNHALLLALDPGRGEAALMPGYGLEPLLESDALAQILDQAAPAWSTRNWTEGILGVLDGLDRLLESVAERKTGASSAHGEF